MHPGAGQAVHGEGAVGEYLGQLLADLLGAHVGGDTGLLAGLIDGIDAVVAVSGELVGDAAGQRLILVDELHGALVLAPGIEGGHQHQALGQAGVKALQVQDAVHAVAAEEGGLIAHGLGLVQDQGGGGVVDGHEHQVGAGLLGLAQLHGKVGVGVVGEGAGGDDLQADLLGLRLEGVEDAGGIGIAVVIDGGDLGAQLVLLDVVRSGLALVGVGEAGLEHVVAALGHLGGGGGGGQLEDAVVKGLGGHGHAGGGGGGAVQHLHPLALQVVIGVDGLLGIALVILKVQGKLQAAQGVDLIHGDLSARLGGDAVHGARAGQGADTADLDDVALIGRAVGSGAGVRGGAVRTVAAAAASQQADAQGAGQKHGKILFHFE